MGDKHVFFPMNGEMLIQKVMFGGFFAVVFIWMLMFLLYILVSG